jgi:hypothetical protein
VGCLDEELTQDEKACRSDANGEGESP